MIEMYLAPELTAHGSVVSTTRGQHSSITMENLAGVFSPAVANTSGEGASATLTETSSETLGDGTTAT